MDHGAGEACRPVVPFGVGEGFVAAVVREEGGRVSVWIGGEEWGGVGREQGGKEERGKWTG
jgi:hypothetical protein